MKFFWPFWFQDKIYIEFNPVNETYLKENGSKYLWEITDDAPFDGLLLSQYMIKEKMEVLEGNSIREEFMLPDELEIFIDCGAYSYRNMDNPPYESEQTLEFYKKMNCEYGVTIDHLIMNKHSAIEKQRRFDLTIKNAKEMKDIYTKREYGFKLFGVVQGWDINTYKKGVIELINSGFEYIALGGLVRKSDDFIISILDSIKDEVIENKIKIHLFGIIRPNIYQKEKYQFIYSFDNAYHRRAWLSARKNYSINMEKYYSALRIPSNYNRNDSVVEKIFDLLKHIEKTQCPSEDAIAQVSDLLYKIKKSNRISKERIRRTIEERPWEKCDCQFCHDLGIHIIVFRGAQRNFRRSFHLLNDLYKWLNNLS